MSPTNATKITTVPSLRERARAAWEEGMDDFRADRRIEFQALLRDILGVEYTGDASSVEIDGLHFRTMLSGDRDGTYGLMLEVWCAECRCVPIHEVRIRRLADVDMHLGVKCRECREQAKGGLTRVLALQACKDAANTLEQSGERAIPEVILTLRRASDPALRRVPA